MFNYHVYVQHVTKVGEQPVVTLLAGFNTESHAVTFMRDSAENYGKSVMLYVVEGSIKHVAGGLHVASS